MIPPRRYAVLSNRPSEQATAQAVIAMATALQNAARGAGESARDVWTFAT